MGHTHYWEIEKCIDSDTFLNIVKSARCIISLRNPHIKLSEVNIDSDSIIFNGFGGDAHETFYMTTECKGYNYCKTRHKPYDILVTSILIIAKFYEPRLWVSSDGGESDWGPGLSMARKIQHKCMMPFSK